MCPVTQQDVTAFIVLCHCGPVTPKMCNFQAFSEHENFNQVKSLVQRYRNQKVKVWYSAASSSSRGRPIAAWQCKIDRDWTMSTFRLRFCAAALHAQHSCRQDVTILGSKPAVKSIKVCVLGMTENCTEPNISKVLTRHTLRGVEPS